MVIPNAQPSTSNSEFSRNSVTSHKISLLVLIKEFCVVKLNSRISSQTPVDHEITWTHTVKQNRAFLSTILKLIMEPDLSFKELNITLKPVLHPETHNLFLSRLNDIRKNSIDSLFDLFATLNLLFLQRVPVQPLIQKTSVLGIFIRRMLLAFDKLTFSSQTKLCTDFYQYFDAAFKRNDDSNENPCNEPPLFASQRQAEFFLAQQATILQLYDQIALNPVMLQEKILEFIQGNPELFEAYFLSYLNSMRVKDFTLSRNNLIHHFDRNTTVPQASQSTSQSEDLNISSRYAALNLAIMLAMFEYKDQALASLNEAIMLAQEANDNVCLQYALAWLYKLTDENKDLMIRRSITTSSDIGLWSLSSLSMQSLIKLKSTKTEKPVSVFEILEKVDLQNCRHSLTDMMGSTYMLKSGLWSYYGISQMNLLSCQTLLHLNTADHIHNLHRIGEEYLLAMQNMAAALASKGYYGWASRIMCESCTLYPKYTSQSRIWKVTRSIVKFEESLYRGKWTAAFTFQADIAIFDNNEARFRKAQLLIHKGNLYEADVILKTLLTEQEAKLASPHFYIRILLLRAELFTETPNKEVVLPMLMTCLAYSKAHHLLSLEYMTTMQIAAYQLELGLPLQARHLLNEIVVFVMSHGNSFDKGRFCYLYARCLACPALQNLEKDFERGKKELLLALPLIDKSLAYFKEMKAVPKMKKVLCYKARLYNSLNMKDERNNAAHRYRYLEDEFMYVK